MILSSRRVGWLVLGGMMAVSAGASASSNGKTSNGFSASQGCNQCHSGGATPTVALTGPESLQPGEEGTFTLTITTDLAGGGFDVAAPSGTLAVGGPDSGSTKVSKGTGGRNEVVHSATKASSKGVVTFSFLWKAPADATSGSAVELTGWGNAVNGTKSDKGDKAAKATLSVTIAGGQGEGGSAGSGGSGQAGSDAAGAAGTGTGGSAGGGTAGTGTAGSGTAGTAGSGTAGTGTAGTKTDGEGGSAGSDDGAAGTEGEMSGSGGSGVSGASGQTGEAASSDDGGCRTSRSPGGALGAALVALAMLVSKRRRQG